MNRREFLKKGLGGIVIGSIPLIYNCLKNPVYEQYKFPGQENSYKYLVPDYSSEEWKKLSAEEVEAFFQIPEDVLKKLSTKALIQAYLDYPLLGLIGMYSSFQDGFNVVRKKFNGIDELYKRYDIEIESIKFYQNMDPGAYDINWEPLEIGKFTHRIFFIELLLAQEDFLSKLQKKNVKLFISDALNKLELKKRYSDTYSYYHIVNTAFLLAHIINSKGEENGLKTELLQFAGIKGFLKIWHFTRRESTLIYSKPCKQIYYQLEKICKIFIF